MWRGRVILFSDREPFDRDFVIQPEPGLVKGQKFDTQVYQYGFQYAFVRAMYEHLASGNDVLTITDVDSIMEPRNASSPLPDDRVY